MAILGLRCSNSDITFVVLEGSRDQPSVVVMADLSIPSGFKQPEALDWVYQETELLVRRHNVEMVVMNKFQGRRRDQAYADRVSIEAAVTLAAHRNGQLPVFKKVKSTIAKDMGFKGRARYLRSDLDTSPIDGYDGLDEKSKDAILAAWSELS
jgi:hypothetical protein